MKINRPVVIPPVPIDNSSRADVETVILFELVDCGIKRWILSPNTRNFLWGWTVWFYSGVRGGGDPHDMPRCPRRALPDRRGLDPHGHVLAQRSSMVLDHAARQQAVCGACLGGADLKFSSGTRLTRQRPGEAMSFYRVCGGGSEW